MLFVKRLFLFSCAALFLLSAASPLCAAQITVNKIAAVVNGEMVTLHEIRERTAAQMKRMNMSPDDPRIAQLMRHTLDGKIAEILIRQQAAKYKITISDADVNNEIRRIREGMNLTPTQFEAQLVSHGDSMKGLRESVGNRLLNQRMMSMMVARKVVVTQAEIEKYYNEHKDEFAGGKQADFSVIVFKNDANAKKVYDQLTQKKISFAEAASKYSADASASTGGAVKNAPWGTLSPNMRTLLDSLQPGQLSPLMKFQETFAVVRLDGLTEGSGGSLAAVSPQIEQRLREQLLQKRFEEYTTQLREKAVVDIRL